MAVQIRSTEYQTGAEAEHEQTEDLNFSSGTY